MAAAATAAATMPMLSSTRCSGRVKRGSRHTAAVAPINPRTMKNCQARARVSVEVTQFLVELRLVRVPLPHRLRRRPPLTVATT